MTCRRFNKYGAVKTEYRGVKYDSKAEARYAMRLDLLVRANEIHSWQRQVTIQLGPDFTTKVDFLVFTKYGAVEAHEVKGVETPRFRDVRRLWAKYGPCTLVIVKGSDDRFKYERLEGR